MKDDHIAEAAKAHTNLNILATVQAILEGGVLYGERGQKSAQKVIEICQREMKKELSVYDTERVRALSAR